MKKFTLEELKFADEVCFPENFRKLIEEVSEGKINQDFWWIDDVDFRKTYNNKFLAWVFSHSRASLDKGYQEVIEEMIEKLIQVTK